MRYEINGVSLPFGGISWSKNKSSKEMFSYLFLFLESKRILVNPIEMEIKEKKIIEKIINVFLNILIYVFAIILLISIYNNLQVKVFGKVVT